MSIITFVNNIKEETGKSMSLVAIATYMAIEYNNKVLILSTTDKKDKIKSCFFEDKQVKKIRLGIFGENKSTLDTESGIEGIAKIVRSNRLTPDMITNYTKVVFKDRLEILLGAERKEKQNTEQMKINEEYINVIATANNYYDKIFVDLDENITEDVREKIINMPDLVIVNSSLEKLKQNKETNELLNLPKILFLIGRYDKYSKYNSKNITRYLEEKNQVLTIPYNTLFFEALNEAGVPDLFLKFKKLNDTEDRNAIFIQEIKRASENIVYRIQELQARM